jgi:hypothetical protein
MSYIGLNPQQQLLNTSTEFFSGDASTVQFFLSRSVASASDLDVMIGNVAQRPFVDYVAQNVSLQFTSAPAAGSNNITVTFRAGALNSLDLTANAFGAGTVGQPAVYSVAANNTGIYWPNATTLSVTVAGSDRAQFSSNVNSTSNATGALTVAGGVGITGNINTSGLVAITNVVNSSNINTGALTLAGGAGIVGNLNVGGDITCVGDFTVNGTFTTTGTDALVVEDPFIFLANANPGDSFDTGVVSQYDDGVTTRYTGYFRDITDGKYRLFGNLLTKPTTVVDTADPSFQLDDLLLASLSATGNVNAAYFVGDGSALTGISTDVTQIFNSNSRVTIPTTNGNIISNVNNVTISVISSTGADFTGIVTASSNISAAGNVLGGNVSTAGIVTATGNIVSAANISGGNLLTGGGITATANVTGGNLTTAGQASAGGNIVGGNIRTAGLISATGDVYGTNVVATKVDATANITGGNLVSLGSISATSDITGGGVLSVIGNVTGGNVNTGILSLSGNVISPIATTSNITTTANIAGGNIVSTSLLQGATLNASGAVTLSATTQAIAVGTSQTTGTITLGGTAQTGAINIGRSAETQSLILANGAVASGNLKTVSIGESGADGSTTTIAVGPITGNGTGAVTFNTGTTVTIANTSGSALSVAGNVTGGNLRTSGVTIGASAVTGVSTLSASGTITGGNLDTGGTVSAAGTVTGGNIATAGTASAGGNVTGGNILTTGLISVGGSVSATGNVTGGNVSTAGLITATGNITATANIAGGNILTANLIQGATVSATGNVIGANVQGGTLSLSGNVISALNMTTQIITTANITGGNLNTSGAVTGNGRALTSLSATNVDFGTLAQARLANSAVTLGSTALTLGATVTTVAGLSSVTSTTFVGALTGAATTAGTVTTAAQPNITSVGTLSSVTVTANVAGGNLTTAGQVVATGNITGGNLITAGLLSVSSIVKTGSNGVGNIGQSDNSFNTVFAKATSAQYADLAEMYCADADYAPGTVLSFGGTQEVTISATASDARVAGVVSTNPAHLMNSTLDCDCAVALALTGRVPTLVTGPVRKGDMMISAGNGHAQACAAPAMGTVIGKAIEDFDGETGTIEIVVGRM